MKVIKRSKNTTSMPIKPFVTFTSFPIKSIEEDEQVARIVYCQLEVVDPGKMQEDEGRSFCLNLKLHVFFPLHCYSNNVLILIYSSSSKDR